MTLRADMLAYERSAVLRLLEAHDWNVTHAALTAGETRQQFYKLMSKHGIRRQKRTLSGISGAVRQWR